VFSNLSYVFLLTFWLSQVSPSAFFKPPSSLAFRLYLYNRFTDHYIDKKNILVYKNSSLYIQTLFNISIFFAVCTEENRKYRKKYLYFIYDKLLYLDKKKDYFKYMWL
jgi:uncharacterized protein with ParB-like and HNH nuclease domain